MPRLSLYRPNKGNDYKFIDKNISEQFTVGGVDINLHKYLGPQSTGFVSNTEPGTTGVTSIQDLLFLENRDRKYDTSVYVMRTQFRINDSDFDLQQFGLFLTGDTIFATFHLNDMVETLGRKIMVGDVLEMPFLKDYYPLDATVSAALKRYYVVQDATRAAEGFSPLWYPHLWRVKLQPLVDAQEYKDILDNLPANDTNNNGILDPGEQSLGNLISSYNKLISINDAVIERAEDDVPMSGYDTSQIYVLPTDANGNLVDPATLDASDTTTTDASDADGNPDASSLPLTTSQKVNGYLTGNGLLPNGKTVSAGIGFPQNPQIGDYFLRLDYLPNRLFRFDGSRWVKVEDAVRTNLTPGSNNQTQRSGFVNNTGKFMSNAIARDAIRISSPYTSPANASTLSFTLSNVSPYGTVVTKTPYNSAYGVQTYLNNARISNTIGNTAGNISFTVTSQLPVGNVLEYTIYEHVINERQSLSEALRPSADNI
jgi:hypothetical protein